MIRLLLLSLLLTPMTTLWSAPTNKTGATNLPKVSTLIPQLLPRNPNAKPPPAAVQKQLEAFFFLGVQAGKIDECFKTLVATNPTLSDPASVPEFVSNIQKGIEVFGPFKATSCMISGLLEPVLFTSHI